MYVAAKLISFIYVSESNVKLNKLKLSVWGAGLKNFVAFKIGI